MRRRGFFADQPVNVSALPSFRAEHFPYSGPYPWLDQPDAFDRIEDKLRRGEIGTEEAEQCRRWAEKGYIILDNLIEDRVLDGVWDVYEKAIRAGRIVLQPERAGEDDPFPGRFLNPHKKVAAFCRILKRPNLLRWIRVLMEREPKPLQTIASHKGSQQGAHSDSIHMTTYPLGYLSAAWIAFEDIHPDSGPLVIYPGSHKLPYVFSTNVGISESDFQQNGYSSYQAKYEPFIKQLIEKHGLEPEYFHARKGDVLIWHANLIHGGSPRRNMLLSRKAVVCHFFVKGSFVYHDLAATRSRQQYIGTCLLRDESGDIRIFGRKR
ncbi:MAG: phytanoyl-CoA dioxygenase family protein [Bryobacteraceae bacterium]